MLNSEYWSNWRTTSIISPRGISFNYQGLLYLISSTSIYSLSSTGTISSVVFISPQPNALTFDPNGQLWVADSNNGYIYRIQLTCTIPTPPYNGQAGTCISNMNYNTTCQFICNSGYTLTGISTLCLGGSVIPQTCLSSTSSCQVVAPLNGQVGSCGSTLTSGSSCTATCNSGYQASVSIFNCQGGVLTSVQTCSFIGIAYSAYVTGTLTWGLAIDYYGNIYTTTGTSNTLLQIPAGSLIANTFATGFNFPYDLTTDPTNANIYVSNFNGNSISKIINTGGNTVSWIIGLEFSCCYYM